MPPCITQFGMTRCNVVPVYPKLFTPLTSSQKFHDVKGAVSSYSLNFMDPKYSSLVFC